MSSTFGTSVRVATDANTPFREAPYFVVNACPSIWIGEFGETSNMDREVFIDHLLRASEHCREVTMRLVVDSLPSTYAFWVMLNCSYDRNTLRGDLIVFPDDVRRH